jgi:2-furoyl-CoA dehydrogenase FAD binding subunit
MKPRPFDYARPDTIDEALALLSEHGDEARVLAGGQSLMAMMNLRLADPAMLIDITRIPELAHVRDLGEKIEVGAAVTQNRLLAWPDLAKKLPLLAVALPHVGHFQTRNKGTVCGSIAHADPSSEIPLALAILDGAVVLRSARGERVVKAKDFQLDMMTTAREGDELIVAVRFPTHTGSGVAFREAARRHGDFAMVAVAAFIEDKGSARLGIGGMAATPVVRHIATDDIKDAVERIATGLEDYEDLHASAGLRRDILRNLAPIVVAEAQRCAA